MNVSSLSVSRLFSRISTLIAAVLCFVSVFPPFACTQTESSRVSLSGIGSGTEESFYSVSAELPESDLSGSGPVLRDLLAREWATYDSMSETEKLASSHLWGNVSLQTDTWQAAETAAGLSIHNPLEALSFLEPVAYFGTDSADPQDPARHVSLIADASQTPDRTLGELLLTSGYRCGNVRITFTAALRSRDGVYSVSNVWNGTACYEAVQTLTGSGLSVLTVTTDETNNTGYYGGSFYDISSYWVRDGIFYTLRVFGDKEDENEIRSVFDRILPQID